MKIKQSESEEILYESILTISKFLLSDNRDFIESILNENYLIVISDLL